MRSSDRRCVSGQEAVEHHSQLACNTPKIGSQRNVFPGALLHDPIAQVRRERPLTESFEKKSCKFGLQCTSSMYPAYDDGALVQDDSPCRHVCKIDT
ncbi:hypothetical protein Tco_0066306 [Tanacetum coccineum]